jgi:hypothetical protein
MENLHKDNKAKMDGILTNEQKAQLEKQKSDQKKCVKLIIKPVPKNETAPGPY